MAQVSNYGTLKTWLSSTSHRGDLTADIPGFIQSAESMIAEHVRSIEMVTTTPLVEADRSAGAVYNLPDNFLGARAVTGTRSSAGYALKQVSIAELYRYGTSGDPVVFSVYDRQIEFRAAPAVDTEFEIIFYARPAAFSDDADTNTLLLNHVTLYQHSAMHWLHIHTQDVELASAHESAFMDTAAAVSALAEEVRGAASVANQQNYYSQGTM
jgi:hypothetical protein